MTTEQCRFLTIAEKPWVAPAIGAGGALAGAITAVVSQDWSSVLWATLAGMWALMLALHRCPPPPPVDRGLVIVDFEGGPLDGELLPVGEVPAPPEGGAIFFDGARYRVQGVHCTHFRFELEKVGS